MCTKAEVEEAIAANMKTVELEVGHIKDAVEKIEKFLANMPCADLMERVLRVEIHQENIQKIREQDKKDIDLLYGMTRDNATAIATLSEQNAGQDKISARTWAIILIVLSLIFNIAGHFLR